jgi:hypothetical protein
VQEVIKAQPKHFILRESGNAWKVEPNIFKRSSITEKNKMYFSLIDYFVKTDNKIVFKLLLMFSLIYLQSKSKRVSCIFYTTVFSVNIIIFKT